MEKFFFNAVVIEAKHTRLLIQHIASEQSNLDNEFFIGIAE